MHCYHSINTSYTGIVPPVSTNAMIYSTYSNSTNRRREWLKVIFVLHMVLTINIWIKAFLYIKIRDTTFDCSWPFWSPFRWLFNVHVIQPVCVWMEIECQSLYNSTKFTVVHLDRIMQNEVHKDWLEECQDWLKHQTPTAAKTKRSAQHLTTTSKRVLVQKLRECVVNMFLYFSRS